MSTQFAAGRYQVQITNQYFFKSSNKGTLGFQLEFQVLANLDHPETEVKSYQRNLTLWITESTVKRRLHDLRTLGYEGTTLRGVHPDVKGFHDFRDQETELVCTHETNDGGGIFEKWSLQNSRPKLIDKTALDSFDRLLEQERTSDDAEESDESDIGGHKPV